MNRWYPHIAGTLEYTGIIAIPIGFLYLISGILPDVVIGILFLFGILALVFGELYLYATTICQKITLEEEKQVKEYYDKCPKCNGRRIDHVCPRCNSQ